MGHYTGPVSGSQRDCLSPRVLSKSSQEAISGTPASLLAPDLVEGWLLPDAVLCRQDDGVPDFAQSDSYFDRLEHWRIIILSDNAEVNGMPSYTNAFAS